MKPVIGILGGIGPESSANFYKKLIAEIQVRKLIKNNEDYPHVIINSIPAPELVSHSNLKPYTEGLSLLEKAGANVVAIVCNTAHLFFEELQREIKIPIIDLRKEVADYMIKNNVKEILILGSKRTIDSRIFFLEDIKNIELSEKEKDELNGIILNYNQGKKTEEQKRYLLKLIRKYNSQKVLLACTELSSLLSEEKIKKIDTMNILLEATIRKWIS